MKLLSKFFIFGYILIGSQQVSASEISEKMLQADYDQCVIAAGANQNLSEEDIDYYCNCVADSIGEELTLDEYTRMSVAASLNQPSPEFSQIISEIAAFCISETLN